MITVPTVAITQADGNAIRSRLTSGPVDLTWTNQTISVVNPTGGLISSFSTYGLSPDLALKPDIGAPGGSIWSTYPIKLGEYTSLSGTSMASPHVAGTVAPLLQAKPSTSAQAVRGILQNSAEHKVWSLELRAFGLSIMFTDRAREWYRLTKPSSLPPLLPLPKFPLAKAKQVLFHRL